MTGLISFLIYVVSKSKTSYLLLIALIYIVIGLLFFCYLIISQLRIYPYDDMMIILPPRRPGYYSHYIYNIIIGFNVCSVVFRIFGSISILCFRYVIRTIEARSKINEFNAIHIVHSKNQRVSEIFIDSNSVKQTSESESANTLHNYNSSRNKDKSINFNQESTNNNKVNGNNFCSEDVFYCDKDFRESLCSSSK